MWPNPQFPSDLVTFTEEILNGKLHFLCSDPSRPDSGRREKSFMKYLKAFLKPFEAPR